MLAHIIRKPIMLDLVERTLGFVGDLLEAHPHEQRSGDVIADDARLAALAALQARDLRAFAVKLLELAAPATHLLYGWRVILSEVVGHAPVA